MKMAHKAVIGSAKKLKLFTKSSIRSDRKENC